MGKNFFLQCFGIFFMLSVTAYSADIKGSSDHPMIGRFDGAEIVAYQKRNFDEMTFLVSELARGQETKTLDVEGKVTE